jgi:hypothetical protein
MVIKQNFSHYFVETLLFEQAEPVFAPPGQDLDQVFRQIPSIEHDHAEGHFVPDGRFHQVARQGDFGPKLLVPRPKLGILEQDGVDLLMQTIPRLFVRRDLDVRKVLGHVSCPLSQFLVAPIQT